MIKSWCKSLVIIEHPLAWCCSHVYLRWLEKSGWFDSHFNYIHDIVSWSLVCGCLKTGLWHPTLTCWPLSLQYYSVTRQSSCQETDSDDDVPEELKRDFIDECPGETPVIKKSVLLVYTHISTPSVTTAHCLAKLKLPFAIQKNMYSNCLIVIFNENVFELCRAD